MEPSFKEDLIARMSRAARKMCLADEKISKICRDWGFSDEDIDKIINYKPLPKQPQNEIPKIKKWNSGFDLQRLVFYHDAQFIFYDAVIEGKLTPHDSDGREIIASAFERIEPGNVYDFFYTCEDIERFLNLHPSKSNEHIDPKNEAGPKGTDNRKLRPIQKRKNECVEMASKLWGINNDYRMPDIYNHASVTKIFDRYQREYHIPSPTQETFRSWVTHLNPHREKGGRPKKS